MLKGSRSKTELDKVPAQLQDQGDSKGK